MDGKNVGYEPFHFRKNHNLEWLIYPEVQDYLFANAAILSSNSSSSPGT